MSEDHAPRTRRVDDCGCVWYGERRVPCQAHGRHIPGHPAYMAGLRRSQGWYRHVPIIPNNGRPRG